MDLNKIFQGFNSKKILVVGDVMIDAYMIGKVTRISPEAPVPVVNLQNQEERLGGAANVALNLVAMGATPVVCSVVGNDSSGKNLVALLKEASIASDGVILSDNRQTTVKTRVIGGSQHLLRIDSEDTKPISEKDEDALFHSIERLMEQGVDGLIFEDYNKGVLTENLIKRVIHLAKKHDVPTTVDPKKDNFLAYKGVTLFKPNLKELKEGLGRDFHFASQRDEFLRAVNDLQAILNNELSFVTLSEHGVFIQSHEEQHFISAHLRDIADVSGAGDTVIAVATLCLVSGMDIKSIAEIANLAGGLVCEHSGVVPIAKEKLLREASKI